MDDSGQSATKTEGGAGEPGLNQIPLTVIRLSVHTQHCVLLIVPRPGYMSRVRNVDPPSLPLWWDSYFMFSKFVGTSSHRQAGRYRW